MNEEKKQKIQRKYRRKIKQQKEAKKHTKEVLFIAGLVILIIVLKTFFKAF